MIIKLIVLNVLLTTVRAAVFFFFTHPIFTGTWRLGGEGAELFVVFAKTIKR